VEDVLFVKMGNLTLLLMAAWLVMLVPASSTHPCKTCLQVLDRDAIETTLVHGFSTSNNRVYLRVDWRNNHHTSTGTFFLGLSHDLHAQSLRWVIPLDKETFQFLPQKLMSNVHCDS